MAQATSIAILDAQATPVSHTYIPLGTDKNGIMWFEDQSAASPLGYWKISIERKAPSTSANPGTNSDGRTYRYKVGFHQPVLANVTNSTVSGILPAPTLAYVPRSYQEFLMPERGSLLDRQNLVKMSPLVVQSPQFVTMLTTLGYLS